VDTPVISTDWTPTLLAVAGLPPIEDGRCELFNLAKDEGETTDVSAREPGRVALLRGQLETWRRAVGAQENAANPTFNGKLWKLLYQDVDASRLETQEKASALALKWAGWRTLMDEVLPRKSQSTPGSGAVLLHAREAKIHGGKLRYEAQPLGFWTQRDDWVEWEFQVPGAGVFEVQILQGCGQGNGGAAVEVTVNGQTLATTVLETGHYLSVWL
jgi:hypothetical protein